MLKRLAAIGALAALAGAVAVALAGAWSSPGRAVGVVAAAFAGVLALWWALTTRGVTRWVSAALAAAALGALVAVLATADGFGTLALVVAAGLVSGALADVALDDTPAPRRERRSPPPRAPVLFMNPWSGGGTVERLDLPAEARRLGAEVVMLDGSRDLREMAEEAVDRGADLLGAAGGDGTQALVAGVAAERGVGFLCIPAGTRHHFALDLGLDRDDPRAALRALGEDGAEAAVDLGRVGGRAFVNNVSFGVYAEVVQDPDYRGAKVGTFLQRLPDMMGRGAPEPDLAVETPGGGRVAGPHVVLVSNNPYRLEGVGGLGTRPRLDGGLLGVVALRLAGAADAARIATGGIAAVPGYREWAARSVRVTTARGTVEAGVDGEALVLPTPLDLWIEPGALRVRRPRHRPGTRRRGVRVGRSVPGRLVLVAAGRPDPRAAARAAPAETSPPA